MKKFSFFLLALVICFFLANAMVSDKGYVLVVYEHLTFESSLWGMLLLIVIIMASIWIGFCVFKGVIGASTFVYPWSYTARKNRARRLSEKGLAEFTYGHWKKAERLLAQAAEDGESPLFNYLAAARAAHESGNNEASTEYLRHADHSSPGLGSDVAIGITQAQLQLSGGQLEQALATLTHLYKKKPSHPYILKLLKQAYIRLNDWQAVAKLLPQLKKYKVVDEIQYRDLEKQAFMALFEQAYKQGRSQNTMEEKVKQANNVWSTLSSQQRRNPAMLLRYCRSLMMLGAEDKAEQVLRENLIKNYSSSLIWLYSKIKSKDSRKQLLTAEALLSERTNDPELLLALGRLSMENELWGKALEYFQASLQLRKCVDVYNELGSLLAHMDEHKKSAHYFQEGLKLVTDDKFIPLAME